MIVSGAYQKIPKVTAQNNSGAPMNSVSSIAFLLEPHLFLGTDTWIHGYHLPNLDNKPIGAAPLRHFFGGKGGVLVYK